MSCTEKSLWGESNKYIKIYDNSVVGVNGSKFDFKIALESLKIPYKNYITYKLTLPKDSKDILLFHRNYAITFMMIIVNYDKLVVDDYDKFIKYRFKDCSCETNLTQILMLSGSSDNPLSNILLSNPSEFYDVVLDVLICYDMDISVNNMNCN